MRLARKQEQHADQTQNSRKKAAHTSTLSQKKMNCHGFRARAAQMGLAFNAESSSSMLQSAKLLA